jgi:hypothetical protein
MISLQFIYALERAAELEEVLGQPSEAARDRRLGSSTGGLRHQGPVEQWKGWVTAIDAETGTTKWKVQTPKPMRAAITATAGGLVFTGHLDGQVLAYEAESGKVSWKDATETALGTASPTRRAAARGRSCRLELRHLAREGRRAWVVVYAVP